MHAASPWCESTSRSDPPEVLGPSHPSPSRSSSCRSSQGHSSSRGRCKPSRCHSPQPSPKHSPHTPPPWAVGPHGHVIDCPSSRLDDHILPLQTKGSRHPGLSMINIDPRGNMTIGLPVHILVCCILNAVSVCARTLLRCTTCRVVRCQASLRKR